MSRARNAAQLGRCVILGVGNSLRADDGLGVHIVERLRARFGGRDDAPVMLDAGTLGLSLLPEIEDTDGLIVVDAAEIGADPGSVRAYEDVEMDRRLSGIQRTVHEIAMADLLAAAQLTGRAPVRRALVAVQPATIDWGEHPSPRCADAIPEACAQVEAILERWAS